MTTGRFLVIGRKMTFLAASAMVLLAVGSAEIAPMVVQAPDSSDKID
jgi:hypothetical protein